MDPDQNYFAESSEIGVASPTTPTFGSTTIPPWYRQTDSNLYNSPEAYADDAEDYIARGGAYPWFSGDVQVTASPLTSISSFSTCISPTEVTFEQPESYTQWTMDDWQPEFERDELEIESSGSDPRPPPPKKQKSKSSSHRGSSRHSSSSSKSMAAMLLQPPPPPRLGLSTDAPPSPPTTPPDPRANQQLRTASRKAKRTSAHKPAASEEERRTRASHNLVEKQYRNRLNAQFERLLAVLPPPGGEDDEGADDRRLSKAEVLDIARRRIRSLEKERDGLKTQKGELSASVGRLRDTIFRQRREE